MSENTTILHPTADEVIGKRLGRIRRRHGETVIRELDIDPRSTLENDKGKSRAQGVGRFVLSEGEEGETDDEDGFYPSSSRPGHDIVCDYQNHVSDYGYDHEQSQDIHEQLQVYDDPHAVGNAYGHRQVHGVVEDYIDDEDSDLDALGDAGNKTPAARFPPGSIHRTIEIEDEMVFEKPAAIFDDLDDDDDDDDEYLYREKRIPHNASSIASHEPVSSGSDLALSRYVIVSRDGNTWGTPPPSSHDDAIFRRIMRHVPLLSGTASNQNYEKVGTMHSASSSSSSFITPPPSGFLDQGFQQAQNAGPTLSIKKIGRILFKEKGGQRLEERDNEEVAGGLKKLT